MYQTIGKCDFHDAFRNMGRKDNFSYEGLNALFDYLEGIEGDTGERIELDVIALCCDYKESTFDEIRDNYQNKFDQDASNDEILEELQSLTNVIWHNDEVVLFQEF